MRMSDKVIFGLTLAFFMFVWWVGTVTSDRSKSCEKKWPGSQAEGTFFNPVCMEKPKGLGKP
jgi:hypothetical protein